MNNNKELVSSFMIKKAKEYANIKTLKCYFIRIFDTAEQLDYIEYNRLEKLLKNISSPKKRNLKALRVQQGEALSASELLEWITAIKANLKEGKLKYQDYVLIMVTMYLGDRKSETYALQWKHIDFENRHIHLVQSQDRLGNLKSTKGNKNTIFTMPSLLFDLLVEWKKRQKQELFNLGIIQTENQMLFTYTKRNGAINQQLHIDYLNNRLKAIKKNHSDLKPLNPHKLRHTFGTLASQGGASMTEISKALTHSEIKTTRIYVNAPEIIDTTVHDSFCKVIEKAQNCS